MRHFVRALLCAALAITAFAVSSPAQATQGGTTEGCTPGYWKVSQHWDSWQEAAPTDALQGAGGTGTDGAARILARAAVAAWLNAAYDDDQGHLKFPLRRYVSAFGNPPLVQTVNAALASGNRTTMLNLAKELDQDNNLGCPLS